jgi:hypothetical protein
MHGPVSQKYVPPIQIYYVKYLAKSLAWPDRFHEPPVVTCGKYERVRLRFGNKRFASNPAVSRKGKAMIRVTELDEHRGMTTARKLTAYGDSMFYPYFSPKQIGAEPWIGKS